MKSQYQNSKSFSGKTRLVLVLMGIIPFLLVVYLFVYENIGLTDRIILFSALAFFSILTGFSLMRRSADQLVNLCRETGEVEAGVKSEPVQISGDQELNDIADHFNSVVSKLQDTQRDLEERNKKLSESNKKLSEAYSVIKNDLEAAAKIQTSLLPKSASIFQGVQFQWIFLPSTFVAGDILNYFKLDENHVGFYLLDVAGHGIPAALLSVTLSKVLSPTDLHDNPVKHLVPDPPYYQIVPPAMVIQDLNQRFQADEDTMQYFTMIYGITNTVNGQTKITQAGHPSPIHLKRDGSTSFIGDGGYPVGMLPYVDYDEHNVQLNKGDRLILYSDGITECTNDEKEPFALERLMELLECGKDLSLQELLARIKQNLQQWKGDDKFEDDVTLLAMEIV